MYVHDREVYKQFNYTHIPETIKTQPSGESTIANIAGYRKKKQTISSS